MGGEGADRLVGECRMFDRIWKKLVNRETILYLIFGVLTTLVDWVSYWYMRQGDMDYRLATVLSWAVAVLFAFVTNKLFVFCSRKLSPKVVWKEFSAFVICRAATGIFTVVAMMVLVDGMGIDQDFICKIAVSAISLILNYLFSKLFIFKAKKDNCEAV